MIVEFKFELDTKHIKRIEEKSSYNHNYYALDLMPYGDYILTEKCNVLYEHCTDDDYGAYYSLGYFDENDRFQAMWTWYEDEYKHFRED